MRTVTLTPAEFDALDEYSCSLPTGYALGKKWKRREPYMISYDPDKPNRWLLGEYTGAIPHPERNELLASVQWSLIVCPGRTPVPFQQPILPVHLL